VTLRVTDRLLTEPFFGSFSQFLQISLLKESVGLVTQFQTGIVNLAKWRDDQHGKGSAFKSSQITHMFQIESRAEYISVFSLLIKQKLEKSLVFSIVLKGPMGLYAN